MKRIFSTLVGVCIFSCVGLAASLASDGTSRADDTATEDSLRVEFATPGGQTQTAPYFAVQGAYPGMEPQTALVTLHNTGTLDSAYDLSVFLPAEDGGPQLADVLQVTVTAEGSDETVYRGPLAEFRFDGTEVLDAGAAAGYLMAIEWPDGGEADNAYQGLGLEFELRARGRETT